MGKEYKIHYTDAANERLDALKLEYIDKLEDIVKKRKYVPGDKFVEIAASDLEQASQYIRVNAPRNNEAIRLVSVFYLVMGVFMVIAGLFYPLFIEMMRESPERLVLILVGFTLSVVGVFGYSYIKQKEALSKLGRAIHKNKVGE